MFESSDRRLRYGIIALWVVAGCIGGCFAALQYIAPSGVARAPTGHRGSSGLLRGNTRPAQTQLSAMRESSSGQAAGVAAARSNGLLIGGLAAAAAGAAAFAMGSATSNLVAVGAAAVAAPVLTLRLLGAGAAEDDTKMLRQGGTKDDTKMAYAWEKFRNEREAQLLNDAFGGADTHAIDNSSQDNTIQALQSSNTSGAFSASGSQLVGIGDLRIRVPSDRAFVQGSVDIGKVVGGSSGAVVGGGVGCIGGLAAAPLTLGLSIPAGLLVGAGAGLHAGGEVGRTAGDIIGQVALSRLHDLGMLSSPRQGGGSRSPGKSRGDRREHRGRGGEPRASPRRKNGFR